MGIYDWLGDLLGFEAPSLLEIVFMSSAIFGGLFFLLMMLLMLVGDIFGGIVGDFTGTEGGLGADAAFELFSIQGIAAAVMMFGIAGMFGISATGNDVAAVLIGGVAASASMYGVKSMMQGISHLQADGTVDYRDAIGERGQVYSRIKPNETGEIQVPVDGTLRTLLARAQDKKLYIPSGEFITVTDVIGSTMIVEPLGDLTSEE
jgi:membrane protein implicated in regulation of membrane protease activity